MDGYLLTGAFFSDESGLGADAIRNPPAGPVVDDYFYSGDGQEPGILTNRVRTTQKLEGELRTSFMEDFYYRVYLEPKLIDLKSVTGESVSEIFVWNAWPDRSSTLTDAIVENDTGIEVRPEAPQVLRPLATSNFNIVAGTSGAAEINADVLFTFSTESEPLVVNVIGNRVTKLGVPAEVPVKEVWSWVTNTMKAADGSEQTVSASGTHRVFIEYKVILNDEAEVELFKTALLSGLGKVFVPEWQYQSLVENEMETGTDRIYFDRSRCDVREKEFAMIFNNDNELIVQVASIEDGYVILASPLQEPLSGEVYITPGATGIVGDTILNRYAVDYAGEVDLSANLQRHRAQTTRPGYVSDPETYLGRQVLNRRPMANSLVGDQFNQELITTDNTIGVFDVYQDIDYARVSGSRSFNIERVAKPEDMDFWKDFGERTRGSARPFWMRSYRPDFKLVNPLNEGELTCTIEDPDFASKIFPRFLSHRFVRFENSSGDVIFRNIADAYLSPDSFNTILLLDEAFPAGFGDVTVGEQILPCRIADDKLSWHHTHINSELTFNFVTTDPEV
jgi:hypothetical protein